MLELIPGKPADLDSFVRSFESSELGQIYFSSKTFRQETFQEFSAQKTILTAVSGNDVVGFVCYIPNGAFHGFPYLHLLTIVPEFRDKGFGSQILKAFEEGYMKNASRIFLVVADFNPEAKRFYERNGYSQVGRIPGLYRPDIDEFLMMKIIQ